MLMMFSDAFLSLFQIRSVPPEVLQCAHRLRAHMSSPSMGLQEVLALRASLACVALSDDRHASAVDLFQPHSKAFQWHRGVSATC